jgi:hypothetical protein
MPTSSKMKEKPPREIVDPVSRYRHGDRFSDSYGMACGFVALAVTCLTVWVGADCLERGNRRKGWTLIVIGILFDALGFASVGIGCLPWNWWRCLHDGQQHSDNQQFHDGEIVPRKCLTSNRYWGTVMDMANVLNADKQIAVIGALAEGSSIRSIERITGVHRDTIMRLGVKVGQGCAKMLDTSMRNLPCNRLEMDEIWGLDGHALTNRVYAWMHDTGDPAKPKQHVTVLHIDPALSPAKAVRAFIVQEFRSNAQA